MVNRLKKRHASPRSMGGRRPVGEGGPPEVPGALRVERALGPGRRGEELDRRPSLRSLSIEGVSYLNSYLREGYRGHRRTGLGDAGF